MSAAKIAQCLGRARKGADGWWSCLCPAHDDRSPSLSLLDGERGLIVKCWADCDPRDVLAELRRRGLIAGRGGDARQVLRIVRGDYQANSARRTALASGIWCAARDPRGTPVVHYLSSRGITIPLPPSLRWAPSLRRPDGIYGPAMVARVDSFDGELIGVHRTWLDRGPDGIWRRCGRASLGPNSGGAVRLGPLDPDRALIVGEGIETVLSLMQLRGLPGWAAIGTSGLNSLVLPLAARRVLIAVDHDEHGKGEAAAREAGQPWVIEQREVRLAMPVGIGDWNDVLQVRCNA